MNAPLLPDVLARPARHRLIAVDALTGAPLAGIATALAWRLGGSAAALTAAAVVGAATAFIALRRARRLDGAWLIRRLNHAAPGLDDSADLLFGNIAALTPLAQLQRSRIKRRLSSGMPDLRLAWPVRRLTLVWLATAAAIAAILGVPGHRIAHPMPRLRVVASQPGIPRLTGQRVRVTPPRYTGLPPRDVASLDLRAPAGSSLDWTLTFAPQAAAAALVFGDGERITLARHGALSTAHRILERATLYRVVPQLAVSAMLPPLHRLDAVADAPPVVRVVAPDAGVTAAKTGQTRWALVFTATDDYGVAPIAALHLTIAEGDGENVKFHETTVTVHGTGPAKARRFAVAVDLAALKFTAGDLVAALEVHDTRTPGPQTARSSSVILRSPATDGGTEGTAAMAARTLPAYFRSERQVIIDAEALIKAQPRLSSGQFLAKSDAIGADQRLLRLRYGQFLGEEQEGRDAAPTADAPSAAPVAEDNKAVTSRFGSETNTLADYGHVHDETEAATLIDPATRKLLKGALDAMWQAELNLRQAQPPAALPFAYTALRLIKQVQQATRIFAAKVGPELPPIDETRRLTGKRDGLGPASLPSAAATPADTTPGAVWQALAMPDGATAAQFAALDRWLRGTPGGADPLAIAAALDPVRRNPGCTACRATLRARLWPAIPRPVAGIAPRAAPDAAGRRYLDALRLEP